MFDRRHIHRLKLNRHTSSLEHLLHGARNFRADAVARNKRHLAHTLAIEIGFRGERTECSIYDSTI